MDEKPSQQEPLFHDKHLQLLKIAIWAKNLAWLVLVISILVAGVRIMEFQQTEQMRAMSYGEPSKSLAGLLMQNPLLAIRLGINILDAIFGGIISFVVLRGAFLGLNMIVETDINYRERKRQAGEQ